MARGVDEVHQVWHSSVARIIVERQGDPRALDGHAALLLILAAVCESPLAGCLGTDDAGPGDQGVRQRGLAVVHVGDDAQRPDPLRVVHDASHLLNGEGRHGQRDSGFAVGLRGFDPLNQSELGFRLYEVTLAEYISSYSSCHQPIRTWNSAGKDIRRTVPLPR